MLNEFFETLSLNMLFWLKFRSFYILICSIICSWFFFWDRLWEPNRDCCPLEPPFWLPSILVFKFGCVLPIKKRMELRTLNLVQCLHVMVSNLRKLSSPPRCKIYLSGRKRAIYRRYDVSSIYRIIFGYLIVWCNIRYPKIKYHIAWCDVRYPLWDGDISQYPVDQLWSWDPNGEIV